MTESIKTAIKAINKWIFFGWNYPSIEHEWTNIHGEKKFEVVPVFLTEIKWTCNFDHILSKWHIATRTKNSNAYLVEFYAELGNENRRLLLKWVIDNYNDERTICEDDSEECSEAQILAKIREWAEHIPYYLSYREGYARGYREGMIRAHKLVMSMITGEPFEE
ncbi:hypothetical protein E5358_05620 [Palleniella muris]|uniref:Uncharacterized protein n=1 Tax=Palleniella muris TaxID=3038145 RepID=A0AC61QR78_9BACT|nr:hypothetical protein [Palleniella muris]TGX82816.1 hypothetical protein E5358_05620 [Palleniella muris]